MGRYVVILEVRDTQGSSVPNDLKKQVLLDTENGEEVRRFVQRLLKPIYDGEFDDPAPPSREPGPESRSQKRRVAAQKGEPAPDFSREPGQAPVTDAEFPIIPDRYRDSTVAPHPMKVPWSIAELAYSVYVRHGGGDQSLERLAERGGFGAAEMDKLLPDWRERVADLLADRTRYKERIGGLEARLEGHSRAIHRSADHQSTWEGCRLLPCLDDRALLEVPDGE